MKLIRNPLVRFKVRNMQNAPTRQRPIGVLLILALLCTIWPPATYAQEAAPLFCATLSAEDCALLTNAQDQMSALRSVVAQSHIDFLASNIPDAPFDSIAFSLDQQVTQELSIEAAAALLEMRQLAQMQPQRFQQEPQLLLDYYAAMLTGMNLASSVQMSVSEEVIRLIEEAAAAEGEPIPFALPNELAFSTRLVDGTFYTNLSEVADLLPGLSAHGDVWLGVEFAPIVDLAFQAALADADFDDMSSSDAELFAQLLSTSASNTGGPAVTTVAALPFGAELVPFFDVERLENGEVDGQETARLRTTIDYAALLADPVVQELIAELIRSPDFGGQEMDEMEMARTLVIVQQFGPSVLETLGLEIVEEIALETGHYLGGELKLDWDLSELAPLLAATGVARQSELPQLPVIQLNARSSYRDHNADLAIEPPATALIVSTSELLELIPQEELDFFSSEPQPLPAPEFASGSPYEDALVLLDQGDPFGALPLLDEAIAFEPDNAEQYTERGRAHYLTGNYEEALADVERSLELAPSARAYNLRGVLQEEQGNTEQAFADYERAIALDSTFHFAYYNRGLLYTNQGEHELAIADFDAAIEANPNYADAYNERGAAHYRLGNYEDALESYSTAIYLTPNNVRFYTNRGDAYGQLAEYDLALADYESARTIDPFYTPLYNNRGYTYYLLEQYEEAVADYTTAIEQDPTYLLAYANRGDAYRGLGDYEAAVEDYNTVLELDPQYGWAFAARAAAYNDLGEYEQALTDYTAAINFDDQDAYTYLQRGLVYYNLGQLEEEIADYTSALELSPDYATAYYYRALSYQDLGELERALADFNRALELESDDLDILMERGLLYLDLNEMELALADFDQVIEQAPEDAAGYINRSYTYSLLGNYEESRADASRAVELAPENPIAWGNRADANGKLGNYDQAFADFEEALALDPEHATAYLDRGKLYQELGQNAEAIADLERYLELLPNAEDAEEVEGLIDELRSETSDEQGATTTDADEAAWESYTNDEFALSVRHPAAWSVESDVVQEDDRTYLSLTLASSESEPQPGEPFAVLFGQVYSETTTAPALRSLHEQWLTELDFDGELVSEANGTITRDDIAWIDQTYESEVEGSPFILRTVTMIIDSHPAHFFSATAAGAANLQRTMDEMNDSIAVAGINFAQLQGQSEEEQTESVGGAAALAQLLQMVPDTPEYRRYLTFGDAAAWHATTGVPHIAEPDDLDVLTARERDALLFTFSRETMTPSTLGAQYFMAEDQLGHFGFNLFTLDRWLEAGSPPEMLTVVEVSTDPANIASALVASGYSDAHLEDGSTLFSQHDDFEVQLDAPLRTGMMGELNRILLRDGQMIIGRATEIVENAQLATAGDHTSLAEVSTFRAAVQAVTDPTLSELGELVGAIFTEDAATDPAAILGANASAERLKAVRKSLGEATLPPVLLSTFATHRNGDDIYLTLAAVFPSGTDATEVTNILAERMSSYTSVVIQQPLDERWSLVQATPLEVEGTPVALVTMQVTDPEAPLSWAQMVFARDVAFLWSE